MFGGRGDNLCLLKPDYRGCREKIQSDRIFKWKGLYWISRCSIYDIPLKITSQRAARRKYKHYLSHCEKNAAGKVGETGLEILIIKESQSEQSG